MDNDGEKEGGNVREYVVGVLDESVSLERVLR